ncbi:MAG: phosphoribosyltransferase [Bilifractor sp.]|jgi:orotate phosphoribosyltransferase
MDDNYIKISAKMDPNVNLKLYHGHFATPHSHINCYIDITTMKTRCSEAHGVANLLATHYSVSTPVDTIVCMDGTEVIGTYLAEELTKVGILSYNAHKTIYVVPPEYTSNGTIVFRDNMRIAITGKHVLILCGSITTGTSLSSAVECLKYYGAEITGACAIFSMVNKVAGMPVYSAFTSNDIPEYKSYKHNECPLCKQKIKLDAIVNNFGISKL